MMGEVICVSGRAPDVGDILKEAILSQRFADVTLCCPGGQRFLAHRLVLSAASPYLQEVLLAHSKAAAHCEPITVILAEMEAPELAALLGFVYTGSATVPRMRLDAFLRAAETLRIRLPPVPMIATCVEQATDCKPEDMKDVKVCSKYLQCDQYPWYSRGRPSCENITDKKEPCTRNFLTDDNRNILRDTRMLHEFNNPGPSFNPAGSSNAWSRVGSLHQDRRINDHSAEKCYGSMILDDRNLAMAPESSSFDVYHRGACLPGGGPHAEGYADPLERIRTGYERLQVDCPMDKPMNVLGLEGEFCGRMRGDECPYQGVVSSLQCAVTGRTRSFEKSSDYSVTQTAGEDLSCGESCCRWRTARRHVANSVTASPWRQIVRPHHSPRTPRPVLVPQRHANDEIQKKPPEPTRSTVISISPKIHSPGAPRNDGLYGFEVPAYETSFNGDAAARPPPPPPPPRETISGNTIDCGPDAKTQEVVYQSPVPFAPSNQIAPHATRSTNEAAALSSTNAIASAQLLPAQSLSRSNNDNNSVITNTGRITGEYPTTQTTTVPRTPTKPELSHPISRLCDTIESDSEKKETSSETTEKKGDERVARIFSVNSDSNNNNETIVGVEGGAAQRGRPAADDHRCDQCGKTFVTRASLKVHSRTHSGEKPFRCADCGKQFSQLRNYKYHRSVHEGTREFAATCPECGKYFNDRGYLSSHMKIHRNRKEYGCAECGKSFNQRVAYNMHVRIHTGVKPHQCDQCGKAFSRKMLLKQHLRTHSGERPYQCQVCQKAFADRSNMTLHTRLHSGLKPYQCSLCSKAFTKKHHLKTHLNYHTGTKPYSCSNCGGKFSQSSNMRTHFKKCIVNNAAGTAIKSDEADRADRADPENNAPPQMVLTPPNSDQESSILTPISKNVAATDGNT